jgi:hypothetical protein
LASIACARGWDATTTAQPCLDAAGGPLSEPGSLGVDVSAYENSNDEVAEDSLLWDNLDSLSLRNLEI